MAAIKIPYQYRKFKNSKLATLVDKYTHHPFGRMAIVYSVTLLVSIPLSCLWRHIPKDDIVSDIFSLVFGVWVIFMVFVAPMLLPKLSDHFDWAGKIARSKAKKDREQMMEEFQEHDQMMKELLEKVEQQGHGSTGRK